VFSVDVLDLLFTKDGNIGDIKFALLT